jgi:hypothetical protein
VDHYGLLSLLPTVVVITTAVLTHRPVAALLTGVVIGILLLDPTSAVSTFSDIMLEVMQDETIGWVIMVCGLMGSLIYILIKTGGASAFARKMAEHANTRNKSMLVTWFLGMVLFIDDYLNAIAIGNSMKKVTDRFKVSRAMLSYVGARDDRQRSGRRGDDDVHLRYPLHVLSDHRAAAGAARRDGAVPADRPDAGRRGTGTQGNHCHRTGRSDRGRRRAG